MGVSWRLLRCSNRKTNVPCVGGLRATLETEACHGAGATKAFRSLPLILSALACRQTRPSSLIRENKNARSVFNVEPDLPVRVFGMAGSKVRDRFCHAVFRPIAGCRNGR